ncbi:hypothetical protein V1512DRAFT_267040 [Lipomyces arxii]|uniref:uncharacterized protein n=1 Tax=Lipomyces arxii TaxID=56418 RepID=UPI0034CDC5F3
MATSLTTQHRITQTNEERVLYSELFKSLDPESLGIVTGESARDLFQRSGLSPIVLAKIWQIADDQNNGFLNQTSFAIALRLIGYVQNGHRLAPELSSTPGPLPRFDWVPPLNPADRAHYLQLFDSSATNGLLNGNAARDIFVGANLPNKTLGEIWTLADSHDRGALDATEFIIAMHLIQSTLNGSMPALPHSIPAALLAAAAGTTDRPNSRASQGITPVLPPPQAHTLHQHDEQPPAPRQRGSFPANSPVPTAAIPRQLTGSSVGSHQSFAPQFRATSIPVHEEWIVTPLMKERYDGIFASIDTDGRGLLGGDKAVPFFMTSKLPDEVLAHIWDLCDIRNSGELNRDEFAVAMYLVQQKLSGVDLPTALPTNLVPPSLRAPVASPALTHHRQVSSPPPPLPAQRQPAPVESALLDLSDLDDGAFTSPPPAASTPVSAPTAASTTSYVAAPPDQPSAPSSTASAVPGTTTSHSFGLVSSPPPISPSITGRAPFVPSSAFGQSIQQAFTSPLATAPSISNSTPVTVAAVPPSPAIEPSPVHAPTPVAARSGPPLTSFPQSGTPSVASSTSPPPSPFSPISSDAVAPPVIPQSVFASSPTVPPTVPPTVEKQIMVEHDQIKQSLSNEKSQFNRLATSIGYFTAETKALKEKRDKAEAELEKMIHLRQDIEGKLTNLRDIYESEAQKVRAVEQQLATTTTETAHMRQEHAEMETTVHAIQVQHQEIMSTLESVQTENATLREKIRLLKEQTAQITEAVDKAYSEANHQREYIGVHQQQLAAAELEVEQAQTALAAAEAEAAAAAAEAALLQPIPKLVTAVPEVASRPPSTNPFHRYPSSVANKSIEETAAATTVAPHVPFIPDASTSPSLFDSLFADFTAPLAASSLESFDLGVPSVAESESSFARTGFEDDEVSTTGSSPATTTTAATRTFVTAPALSSAASSSLQTAELESVSSSVQNNAPESIRDGISRPSTPPSVTSSGSVVTASEGDGEEPLPDVTAVLPGAYGSAASTSEHVVEPEPLTELMPEAANNSVSESVLDAELAPEVVEEPAPAVVEEAPAVVEEAPAVVEEVYEAIEDPARDAVEEAASKTLVSNLEP